MKKPPGIKGHFLLGSLKELKKDPLGFTAKLALKHPGIAQFRFLGKKVYVISSPKYISSILLKDQAQYVKSRHYRILKEIMGNGLVTSEGEYWKKQRKLAQPAFHKESINNLVSAFMEETKNLTTKWLEKSKNPSNLVDIHSEMNALSFQIVCKTLLSIDMKEGVKFREGVNKASAFLNKRQNSFINLPLWIPTKANRVFLKQKSFMDDFIYRIIDTRKLSSEKKNDLLDVLIAAKDKHSGLQMSRKQLRDEVMTIFLAGYETTGVALTWTWYLLSQNPKKLKKLFESIKDLDPQNISLEDWHKVDYLSMVIKESLRLFPPIYNIGRRNTKKVKLGEYDIKKGGLFIINIMALHRNTNIWESPNEFIPERFLNEAKFEINAYIPFGIGQRMCIGKNFALLEMKVVLLMLVQKFSLTLKENHPVETLSSITLNPKYGIPMHVAQRK